MRSIEPWVEDPVRTFLAESAARVVLLMTSAGQVVAQHGFTRSMDVMSAAALGAGIVASTEEIGRVLGDSGLGSQAHQGRRQGIVLAPFMTPLGRWIALVVYGPETSLGLVQLFLDRMVTDLRVAAPEPQLARPVLAEDFERDLNASLRALFGR
ncbi:MAG: hypothetical protein SGI84_07870 [Gemmatimonadota bacterium]|nr:hypothetical protein [Gemmatimonadota bacterium]